MAQVLGDDALVRVFHGHLRGDQESGEFVAGLAGDLDGDRHVVELLEAGLVDRGQDAEEPAQVHEQVLGGGPGEDLQNAHHVAVPVLELDLEADARVVLVAQIGGELHAAHVGADGDLQWRLAADGVCHLFDDEPHLLLRCVQAYLAGQDLVDQLGTAHALLIGHLVDPGDHRIG